MKIKNLLVLLIITASLNAFSNTVVLKQLTPSLRIIMRDGQQIWQILTILPDGSQKWEDHLNS